MNECFLPSSRSPFLPAQKPNLRNHRTAELNSPLLLNVWGPSTLFPRTAELIYISIIRAPIPSSHILSTFCSVLFLPIRMEGGVVLIDSSQTLFIFKCPAHSFMVRKALWDDSYTKGTMKTSTQRPFYLDKTRPCSIMFSHRGLMQMTLPFPRSSLPLPA